MVYLWFIYGLSMVNNWNNNGIIYIYIDLTGLPNPGIMVYVRGNHPLLWPQDSG